MQHVRVQYFLLFLRFLHYPLLDKRFYTIHALKSVHFWRAMSLFCSYESESVNGSLYIKGVPVKGILDGDVSPYNYVYFREEFFVKILMSICGGAEGSI